MSPEQEGVFRHKEVAALPAQAGHFNAAPACGQLSVFHHHTLVARRGEAVLDQGWESAGQIEYRRARFHHLPDNAAALRLFFPGEGKLPGIGIGRVEIKGDRPHIFGLLRRQTDIPDRAFVDLVDR